MKTITVLTATRAEYGLLSPIVKALKGCEEFKVKLVVTGTHLSPEFGLTYKEILNDGFEIDKKIEILMSSDSPSAISKSMGLALLGFADYFSDTKPDALMVLGDRYETLAVCCAAMNERIPIIHLYGGETTEGAIDEAVRHCITKMSYLHLTSTQEYRKRVIQLGENPERVISVGSIGVENICSKKLMDRDELEQSLQFALNKPYAVVTYHPVTLEEKSSEQQFQQLLMAIEEKKDMKYIFTKANADADGRIINHMIDEYVSTHDNTIAFESLGAERYLSALKYAAMVIGNSSSGLLEAPSFGIPTINIGDRQKGRLKAESVIDCAPESVSILNAVNRAMSKEFASVAKAAVNPYGDGNTSGKIVMAIKNMMKQDIDLKKKFFDIEFSV